MVDTNCSISNPDDLWNILIHYYTNCIWDIVFNFFIFCTNEPKKYTEDYVNIVLNLQ